VKTESRQDPTNQVNDPNIIIYTDFVAQLDGRALLIRRQPYVEHVRHRSNPFDGLTCAVKPGKLAGFTACDAALGFIPILFTLIDRPCSYTVRMEATGISIFARTSDRNEAPMLKTADLPASNERTSISFFSVSTSHISRTPIAR
jgi:hypothetical protein